MLVRRLTPLTRVSIRNYSDKGEDISDQILAKSKEELFKEVQRPRSKFEEKRERIKEWMQDTKDHYVGGTKELWKNIKLSKAYAKKGLQGHELTRRERRMMSRTLGDVFRVVPFSMFIIIPFMEFLLPVALKIFPNMMPSTYDDPKRDDEKYQKRLAAQVELTKFLQGTLSEMSVQIQKNNKNADMVEQAKNLENFMLSLREGKNTSGLTYEQIKELLPLFNSDLGLAQMRRPQLVAMCKLLETPFLSLSSEESLRIGIRMHLRRLKRDDALIEKEGISSLTDKEVIQACKMRAIRVHDDVRGLREELRSWIVLSRQPGVSNSLLVLSRVLPQEHIHQVADQIAFDAANREVQKIEDIAERRSAEDEQELLVKQAHASYINSRPPKVISELGFHIFLSSFDDIQKQRLAIHSINRSAETLQDTAEEILELKDSTLEYKEEADNTQGDRRLNYLEKKIARSIESIESNLRIEETELVVKSAKVFEEQGLNTETAADHLADKFSVIHEASHVSSSPSEILTQHEKDDLAKTETHKPGGVEGMLKITDDDELSSSEASDSLPVASSHQERQQLSVETASKA
eukprot:TRINITY_DN2033_c0_g3_i1.p1 TRINITY_DN2033_c0_g3~~TRINITY_DN2033_c0_g3_i1.p1  ORF type:complete len:578 (+),score=156.15 TRINITY_DN2033_c0_g3_i1:56-1789(+)